MISRAYLYGGAALAGGLVLYVLAKKRPGESLAGATGRAVASAVGDAGVGAVKGVGAVFGIPDTNESKCDADLAAGNTWAASFSCPASRFIGSVFNSTTIRAAELEDARQIDRILERQAMNEQRAYLPGVYDASTGEQVGAYDEMGNRIY